MEGEREVEAGPEERRKGISWREGGGRGGAPRSLPPLGYKCTCNHTSQGLHL